MKASNTGEYVSPFLPLCSNLIFQTRFDTFCQILMWYCLQPACSKPDDGLVHWADAVMLWYFLDAGNYGFQSVQLFLSQM